MHPQKLKDRRSNFDTTQMYSFGRKFMNHIGRDWNGDYAALHTASAEELEAFWSMWLDESGIICERGTTVLKNPDTMTGGQYFPDTKLNYAENLLENFESPTDVAVIYRDHMPDARRALTIAELKDLVSIYQQLLLSQGIAAGDRVAAYAGNTIETAAFCLAASSLGAIFSVIGPGNEAKSVLDRFSQIDPKVLICTSEDFVRPDGDIICRLQTSAEIASRLPTLQQVIVVPRYSNSPPKDLSAFKKAAYAADLIADLSPKPLVYTRLPFNDPLFILYSSGTTGDPKCITHGIGGTLLELSKCHKLHADLKAGDVAFFQTNSEWMMWHYNLTHLQAGATTILSDVNVKHNHLNIVFDITVEENVTMLGSFAGFYNMLQRRGFTPEQTNPLTNVTQIQSTGSRLMPETFEYFYKTLGLNGEVASISGGTDVISAFVLGCPLNPTIAGRSQCIGLGIDLRCVDETCQALPCGKQGEMIFGKPFPSMPVRFWGDTDGSKYRAAYFETFDNVWRHGDEIMVFEDTSIVVLGRSDETLNINGNRIGPIEIMSLAEQVEGVAEAAVVGRNINGSDYPVMFVVLEKGIPLDNTLKSKIAHTITSEKSPFCLPSDNYIFAVSGLPRAGVKLSLSAIKKAVNGKAFSGKAKMTPENQAYLTEIENLNIVDLSPSKQRIAA